MLCKKQSLYSDADAMPMPTCQCRDFQMALLTKYLVTLFNYNLISNFCQFLMVFINKTSVLVGILIFKAP